MPLVTIRFQGLKGAEKWAQSQAESSGALLRALAPRLYHARPDQRAYSRPRAPVIPLHALSLPLRKVEAGRNRDDTLMHDVGDPHFIGESIVVHTHTQSSVLVHPSVLRFTRALVPETGS